MFYVQENAISNDVIILVVNICHLIFLKKKYLLTICLLRHTSPGANCSYVTFIFTYFSLYLWLARKKVTQNITFNELLNFENPCLYVQYGPSCNLLIVEIHFHSTCSSVGMYVYVYKNNPCVCTSWDAH